MNRPRPLFLTVLLSVATVVTYVGYRLYPMVTPADNSSGIDLPAQLPAVTLTDLDDQPVSITEFRGDPLIINFWATWCGPCLREIPLLKAVQDETPAIQVVGIAVDHMDAVRAFAAEMAIDYPILVGQGDAMDAATQLGIEVFVLPSTVFTSADGVPIGIRVGEIHAEHIQNFATTVAALDRGEIDLDTARDRLAGLQ